MRYRKVDPRVWKDEKFMTLGPREKLIALYCLTSAQTNRIGFFNFSPALAAEDLSFDPEVFAEGFEKVRETLGWRYDKQNRVCFLPTWWRYNHPENQNVLIGNLKDLHELPKTPLLEDFIMNLQYLSETYHQTFLEGIGRPSANQEQEHEQEPYQYQVQEKKQAPPLPPKGKTREGNGIPYQEIIAHLNEKAGKNFKATDDAKALIRARWREGFRMEDFQTVHENMAAKWKNDPSMSQYLRPSTLYRASKFQGYINAKVSLSEQGKVSPVLDKGTDALQRFVKKGETGNA